MQAEVVRLVPKVREEPVTKGKVYIVHAADPGGYSERGMSDKEKGERARISGNGNRTASNFEDVFQAAFLAKLRKTGLHESDDAPMWRYGISIRLREFSDRDQAAIGIQKWLNDNLPGKNHSAHIVLEDGAINVKLNFGDAHKSTGLEEAYNDLIELDPFIKRTFRLLREYASDDDFVWFPYWDWPEELEY